MKKIILLLSTVFIFVSCISFPKSTSNYYFSNYEEIYIYKLKNINVSIDYVNDKIVANQIKDNVESLLYTNQRFIKDGTVINVDIDINQRAFIKNIEQQNSIYISFVGYTDDGLIMFRENMYITGNKNLISAVDQYNCITPILERMIKQQTLHNEKSNQNNEN